MRILNRIKEQKTEIIVLSIFAYELCFPHLAIAAEVKVKEESIILPSYTISATSTPNEVKEVIQKAPEYKVIKIYRVPMTAYNSEVGQTDSTPCHTANGYNLCTNNQENVIAANFLKFGTKVRIPEYFGDRIFTVQDRMNARYYYRADVWFKNRADALKFGVRVLTIEVIE